MEIVVGGDQRGEDLLYVCDRLDALGAIVSWMGYHKDGDELLDMCGENLGMIISDYAKAMRETIDKSWEVINEHFRNGSVSLLDRLKNDKKSIEEGSLGLGMNFKIANGSIQEIDRFQDDDLLQIRELRTWFKQAVREIVESQIKPQQEKAHAAVQAA